MTVDTTESGTAADTAATGTAASGAVSSGTAASGTVSLERLADYLDAGRTPYDPAIEEVPENAGQLAALMRLRGLAASMAADDAAVGGGGAAGAASEVGSAGSAGTPDTAATGTPAAPSSPLPGDDTWLAAVMQRVRREMRAGRDIPVSSPDPRATVHLTEGAVRGLVREAGDTVTGAVVISCHLDGDVRTPGAPIRVEVTISALRGVFVPTMADEVRAVVAARLAAATELTTTAVDIVVGDIHQIEAVA